MNQPVKVPEPSMEEILASIRRIIADDDAGPAAAAEKAESESGTATAEEIDSMFGGPKAKNGDASASADVFDLTESMQSKPAALKAVESTPEVDFSEPTVAEEQVAPAGEAPQPRTADFGSLPLSDRALLSPRATAAVDTAFNSLAHTVLSQNARTLEDLVREMLKPMLKSWLDDNLPNMVERLVRAEIERVSRGRG
jgi:uncharacterized protein